MPDSNFRVQLTRGTTAQADNYIGRAGELAIDLEKQELRALDGQTPGGIFSIGNSTTGGVTDSVNIKVDDFAGNIFTAPTGVTITKEYSNSSLKITHNKNKYPISWFGFNKESSPFIGIVPNSTRNIQVVDQNTVILTNMSEFNMSEFNLLF